LGLIGRLQKRVIILTKYGFIIASGVARQCDQIGGNFDLLGNLGYFLLNKTSHTHAFLADGLLQIFLGVKKSSYDVDILAFLATF